MTITLRNTKGSALTHAELDANFSSFTASDGSSLVGFTQSGSMAVARTVQSKARDIVSAKDFGENVTAADVNEALAAVGVNGMVFLPEGAFTWTETVTVGNRQHLWGAGEYATLITFAPTANDTCIEILNAGSIVNQGSLRDFTLFSNDSTYTKIAIDIVDASNFEISGITIGGSVVVGSSQFWSGVSSIGLRTRGREAVQIKKLQIYADRPILIADNPNTTIDIDHFHFQDLYLVANGNPHVEIATGINLNDVIFDGYQAWALGTHGLYWVDTTSASISANLVLKNVRWEQGTSATADQIHIEHNTGLQGLIAENCYGGTDRDGLYLRKVRDVTLIGYHYVGTTGVALDADATVQRIRGQGCFWQAGSTKVLAGQRLIYAVPFNPNTGALSPDFMYDESANAVREFTTEANIMGPATSIAQDAAATIGTASELSGYLHVVTDEDVGAIYFLKGATNGVAEINDWAGFFSDTKDTATSYNIYYEAPSYKIQNKRTGTHVVRWVLFGANI